MENLPIRRGPMGRRSSKSILFCLLLNVIAAVVFARPTSAEETASGKRRVAVMPFEVRSEKEGDAFLADGFPDTLTSALSQVSSLILVERRDLKTVLDEQSLGQSGAIDAEAAAEAGKVLGAQTVVLGSFTRIGSMGRGACRLVDTASGRVDHSHTVQATGNISGGEALFGLMDNLAAALLESFGVEFTKVERKRVTERATATKNVSAYEYYIKGREKMLLADNRGYAEAAPLFEKAIEVDPGYALAYAALAETYYYRGFQKEQNGEDAGHLYEQCYDNAKKAVELNNGLAEAHRAMAAAYSVGEQRSSEFRRMEAKRAVELNPTDAESIYALWLAGPRNPDGALIKRALSFNPRLLMALNGLGIELASRGRLGEATARFREAVRVNPKKANARNNLGVALKKKGKLTEAIEQFRKAVQIDPRDASSHFNLGNALAKKGDFGAAIKSFGEAVSINPRHAKANYNLGLALEKKGKRKKARRYYKNSCKLGYSKGCKKAKKR